MRKTRQMCCASNISLEKKTLLSRLFLSSLFTVEIFYITNSCRSINFLAIQAAVAIGVTCVGFALRNKSFPRQTLIAQEMETENKKLGLKHLGFVRIATFHAVMCVSNLYEYGKQNSGPLKSMAGTVEGAVTAIVTPVYRKFADIPDHLLVFLDGKVDEASHEFDEKAPPLAKRVVGQAQALISIASEKASKVVNEGRKEGPRAAVNCAAAEAKELIVTGSVNIWLNLDKYPTVHSVAKMAVPTATHLLEKYNVAVKVMSQRGYRVFNYIPAIPIDEIAKAVRQCEAKKGGAKKEGKHKSDSD